MKAQQVIAQLQNVLPRLTNLFSDELEITAISQKGGLAYITTELKHPFQTGNYVNISGVRIKNKLSSLTRTGSKALAITEYPHDLTLGYQLTANISGADQEEYNGDKQIVSVSGINQFEFMVPGVPDSPATGDICLNELRLEGFNGWQKITVVDSNTFSYPLTLTLPELVPEVINAKCRYNLRISGHVSIEATIDSYTQRVKNSTSTDTRLWAYVVLENVDVSKNRNIETDTTDLSSAGDRYQQRLINRFSVFVFCPTTVNISALDARDLMENIAAFMWASILRVKFPTGLSTYPWSQTTTLGHELSGYNDAFLMHRFKFEAVSDLTLGDTTPPDANVAFREIDFGFLNQAIDNDYVEMTATAKLNDNS